MIVKTLSELAKEHKKKFGPAKLSPDTLVLVADPGSGAYAVTLRELIKYISIMQGPML